MSFLIKSNGSRGRCKRKVSNNQKRISFNHNHGEISGSEEEEEEVRKTVADSESSADDETESPQEKKLRLAKVYLEEIQRQERKKEDNENIITSDINKSLRENYLHATAKLKSLVAHKYIGADADKIKIMKCKFHRKSITCLCITSDCKFAFSGSKDGSIVKWCLQNGQYVNSIPFVKHGGEGVVLGHSKGITGIAVSHDLSFLAVSDETKNIQIWNPVNLQHINTLSGHRDIVMNVVFRKNSHTLYSCSKDSSVKVWSLDDMAYVESLFGHQRSVMCIDALIKETAVTSGADATVRIWRIPEETQLIYSGQVGSIDVVKFLNEDCFISGGDSGNICIWERRKKKPLCIISEAHGLCADNSQPFWITSIACLHNTDLIASGSHNGFIIVWQLTDSYRTCNMLFKIPIDGFVNDLCFTSDGRYLIAGIGRDHKFGRWNVMKTAKPCVVIIPLLKTED